MVNGIQETRWSDAIHELKATAWGAIRVMTANDPADSAHNGVALPLTGALAYTTPTIERPSPRILSVRLQPARVGIPRMHVIVGYAPATTSSGPPDPEFKSWLATLEATLANVPPWLPAFVLADFNARLGQQAPDDPGMQSTAHGGYGYGTLNARGSLVHEAAIRGGLCAINTWFDVPDDQRITHVSSLPGAPTSKIDYILCPLRWVRRCRAASLHPECVLNSDHIPVVADFHWHPLRPHLHKTRPLRVDWSRVRRLPDNHFSKMRQNYQKRLEDLLTDLANDSLDTPAAID